MKYPNPNEQEQTAEFERLCGGIDQAQRLFRIFKNSRGYGNAYEMRTDKGRTQEQVFRKTACEDGFTHDQINALLRLQ